MLYVERGHLACDAVRELIGAAEHFQVNFLSKDNFHSVTTREVPAQEEGQEPQLITLAEDLENLRDLAARAKSVLEDARVFSFWTAKSMRI